MTNPLLARWQADPSKATELRQLLDHPILKEALDVLVENGLPTDFGTPTGVDFAIWNATQNTRSQGYFKFRGDLFALTVVPKQTQPVSPRSWAHVSATKSSPMD